MLAREPGRRAVVAGGRGLGHEDLEGELRQRAGRYEQKVLALDEGANLAKEGAIELMGAGVVEGKGVGHLLDGGR